MYAKNCLYRSLEIPACNTQKNLRKCDSIICCSICPRMEYCSHVCGHILFEQEQEQDINFIIENLKIIEIELFAFCNRKCSWCPNGQFIDRINNKSVLNKNLLQNFLQQLQDLNYSGVFSFSRYNEPFANFELFQDSLLLIKEYFPYAKLVTNSNGDYLNKSIIDNMLIDELTIMDYDCRGKEYCLNKMLEWDITEIQEYSSYFIGKKQNKIILYYYEWPKENNFSDRGGLLIQYSTEERKDPCFEPFHFLGLNYDGTLSPCCNIRNDSIKHKEWIYGDLNNETLKDILLSDKVRNFKNKIITGNYDKDMPCFYCNNSGGRYSHAGGSILYE